MSPSSPSWKTTSFLENRRRRATLRTSRRASSGTLSRSGMSTALPSLRSAEVEGGAVGSVELELSVGGSGECPAAFVDEVMVVVAEQGEVLE